MPESSTTKLQSVIDRMNAGDRGARDELINRSSERLLNLARKMLHQDFPRVRRWEGTGDVRNNAVIRLLHALQAVPLSTTADFFRLAARHIRWELLDLARRHNGPEGIGTNQVSIDGANDSGELPPVADRGTTTFNPSSLAAWTELHRAVESLPEAEKDVFDLLWYQECTQAETAAILKVSVPTVKRLWMSARSRLADLDLDQA
jgi:RNA polymerase sigma factor (sigma-70 family)